jgi:hypothetical protein
MSLEERMDSIRRNREFPIYLWGYKARKKYLEIAENALSYVLKIATMERYFPIYVFSQDNEDGNWDDTTFYFENFCVEKRGNQYCVRDVLNLCAIGPRQKDPHIDFIVAGVDLWSGHEKNNFMFGASIPLIGADGQIVVKDGSCICSLNLFPSCIVSTYRLRDYPIFFLQALHESAHLFGLPSYYRRENVESILGLHCKLADCVVSQTAVRRHVVLPDGEEVYRYISPLETWKYVKKRYKRSGKYFCEDCETDLNESREVLLSYLFI